MDTLNLVYDALQNLESADKVKQVLGGDVLAGSFVVRHYLGSQTYTKAEDIEKLTYVNNELNFLSSNADTLDSLLSLDYRKQNSDGVEEVFLSALASGVGYRVCRQTELSGDAVHFKLDSSGLGQVADLGTAKKLKAFSKGFYLYVSDLARNLEVQPYHVYEPIADGVWVEC